MFIGSLWIQVNYEDMCIYSELPKDKTVKYAPKELLDTFVRNYKEGSEPEWQSFTTVSGIAYIYPAVHYFNDNVYASTEPRLL